MDVETRYIPRGSDRDTELLDEYFKLRAEVFSQERWHGDFPVGGDSFDDFSSFVIATTNKLSHTVVGGIRLIVREPGADTPLKIEQDGFSLSLHFPEIDFGSLRCAQISGMALRASSRGGGLGMPIGTKMLESLLSHAQKEEIDIVIANPVLANARRIERLARSRGINLQSYPNIEFPAKALARARGYDNILMLASYRDEIDIPMPR